MSRACPGGPLETKEEEEEKKRKCRVLIFDLASTTSPLRLALAFFFLFQGPFL